MNPTKDTQCPNCGNRADENYCPRCGQPTHLHDETFFSLVTHFFAHYFHYESKFWKTIGALVTQPGELTIAYHKKQRARYVAPMSLYIFIVAAYFLVSGILGHFYESRGWSYSAREELREERAREPRPENAKPRGLERVLGKTISRKIDFAFQDKDFDAKMNTYSTRIFFFMIPVLAVVLSGLFFRKKQFLFVDHAVFALHVHSFWFLIIIIPDIFDFLPIYSVLNNLAVLALLLYTSRAMNKVYSISFVRAAVYSILTVVVYLAVLFTVLILAILQTY